MRKGKVETMLEHIFCSFNKRNVVIRRVARRNVTFVSSKCLDPLWWEFQRGKVPF